MNGLRLVPVLLGTVVLALGATSPTTSEGYAYSTYRETGDRLTVLVDSYPASLHDQDAFIPLLVAVGLTGSGKSVLLTPESFKLVDRNGTIYEAASYDDIARNYPKRQFDLSLLRSHPMVVGQLFATSHRVAADFYPNLAERGIRIDRVELGPFTWFNTVLYFPRPKAGLDGVLALEVTTGGVESPVEVRFKIPHVVGGTAS